MTSLQSVKASVLALLTGAPSILGNWRVLLPITALILVLWRVHVRREEARHRTQNQTLEEATGIEIGYEEGPLSSRIPIVGHRSSRGSAIDKLRTVVGSLPLPKFLGLWKGEDDAEYINLSIKTIGHSVPLCLRVESSTVTLQAIFSLARGTELYYVYEEGHALHIFTDHILHQWLKMTTTKTVTCWVVPSDWRPTGVPNRPFAQEHMQHKDWSKTARSDVSAWLKRLPVTFEEVGRPFESDVSFEDEPSASVESASIEEGSEQSFRASSGSILTTSMASAASSKSVQIWIQVGNDDREEVLASCTILDASIKTLFDYVHDEAEVEPRSELVELWCESSPGKMNYVADDEALRKWLKGQGTLQFRVMSESDLKDVEFFEEIRAWGADEEASGC